MERRLEIAELHCGFHFPFKLALEQEVSKCLNGHWSYFSIYQNMLGYHYSKPYPTFLFHVLAIFQQVARGLRQCFANTHVDSVLFV